jgi:hypothetical protein
MWLRWMETKQVDLGQSRALKWGWRGIVVRSNCPRLIGLIGIAALMAPGCQRGSDLRGVQGSVTYDEQPIASGTIEFMPAAGTKGAMAGAVIQDGSYTVPKDRGVHVGGKYKVSVVAIQKTGRKVAEMTDKDGRGLDEFANYIPAQYNSATKLEVQISTDNPNRHDFHLKNDSQPAADPAEATK